MDLDSRYRVDNEGEFITNANLTCDMNLRKLQVSHLKSDFELIENLLNLQHDFASIYVPTATLFVDYAKGLLPVMVSSMYKNFFAFYAAIDLTKRGLYGAARPILRYLFESIMIAKFCSVSHNDDLIQKWNNEEHINLSNHVIKKIKTPEPIRFQAYLKPLNSFVHSTKSAQQVFWNIENSWGEIEFNVGIIKVLLECNYHLLNRHIVIDRVVYYVKNYGQEIHDKGVYIKKELKEKLMLSRQNIPDEHKKIIYDFQKSWIVKP